MLGMYARADVLTRTRSLAWMMSDGDTIRFHSAFSLLTTGQNTSASLCTVNDALRLSANA